MVLLRVHLTTKEERYFQQILEDVCKESRMLQSQKFVQHGTTSVFRHSVAVAYVSFWIASRTNAKVDMESLIRGALLHDYFLYDWHVKDDSHKWHGFFHAKKALSNAMEDFELNEVEQNMIKRHMFPLNPIPPRYKEAWILCCADKICSGEETVKGIKLKWF